MAKSLNCPKCKGQVDLRAVSADGKIACPTCGAKLRAPVAALSNALASNPSGPQRIEAPKSINDDDDYGLAPLEAPSTAPMRPISPAQAPTPSIERAPIAPNQSFSSSLVDKKRHSLFEASPTVLAAGAGFVVCVFIGLLVIARMMFGGVEKPGGADFGGVSRGSVPVTLDKPLANVKFEGNPEKQTFPFFQEIKPFESQIGGAEYRQMLYRAVRDKSPEGPSPDNPPPPGEPKWSIAEDPAPKEDSYSLAADLKFPLTMRTVVALGPQPIMPVFADRNGSFAVFAQEWKESPFLREQWFATDKKGKPQKYPVKMKRAPFGSLATLKETDQAPVPVIDLRTGQSVGNFEWRVPFYGAAVLSPSGLYFAGQYYLPPDPQGLVYGGEVDGQSSLYIWKRDSEGPPKALPLTGRVLWMSFIDDKKLALLSYDPTLAVQFWNVESGEMESSVELPAEQRFEEQYNRPKADVAPYVHFYVDPGLGGVSATGKYIAVGGRSAVTLISTADAKIVGAIEANPYQGGSAYYHDVAFSEDGKELHFATRSFDNKRQGEYLEITVASLAEGRLLWRGELARVKGGPLFQYGDSFLFGGIEKYTLQESPSGALFEKYSGRRIADVPKIVRLGREGPVLVLTDMPSSPSPTMAELVRPMQITKPVVLAVDRKTFDDYIATIENTNEHGLPKRPAPLPVVASGASTPVTAPTNWTALPTAARPKLDQPAAIEKLPWPDATGDKVFSYFRARQIERAPPQPKIITADWERFDRATGKRIGEPIPLAPWIVSPDKIFNHYGYSPVEYIYLTISQSPSGNRFAYSDPATPGRVEIFDAEKKWIGGFFPGGKKSVVEWIHLLSDDRVLTQTDGVLSAYTLAEGKLTRDFALDGDFIGPHEFSADKQLLAIGRSAGIDFIDLKSGQVLNRLQCPWEGLVTDMAFSPDGKRLAVIFVSDPETAVSLSRGADNGKYDSIPISLLVWDLTTGEGQSHGVAIARFATIGWLTADHLALLNWDPKVYDLKLETTLLSLKLPTFSAWPASSPPFRRAADGRFWIAAPDNREHENKETHTWRPHGIIDPSGAEFAPLFAADRKLFDCQKTPISVVLDVGDKKLAQKHGEEVILTELQRRGFTIGPGGATLKISPQVMDTSDVLAFGMNVSMKIPKIVYQWELTDKDGLSLWQGTTETRFPTLASKYYVGGVTMPGGPQSGTMEKYDFKGRNPKTAMVEEMFEIGFGLQPPESLPHSMLKGAGKYVRLPLGAEIKKE